MKIGIIGTNFISDSMIEAIRVSNDFTPVVVCSRNIDNAEAFAKKYQIENFTNNNEDLLNYDLDAVYIATPNALHKDISMFFLQNKIPVMCEKPLASNYDDVVELVKCAQDNNTLLAEGIVPVYMEGFAALYDNLDKIGTVRSAVLSYNQYSSRYDAYRKGTVLNAFNPDLSNGSVMDIGVYPISVAVGLFGKPNSITATAYLLSSGVDGNGNIIMHYDDKNIIISHSKINNQMLKPEIQGEDGILQFNETASINEVTYLNKEKEVEILYFDYDTPRMAYEFEAFADAIREGKIEAYEGAHQLSIDIHEVITEARRQTGVVFPADKK